jgi:hypothetical protein
MRLISLVGCVELLWKEEQWIDGPFGRIQVFEFVSCVKFLAII